MFSRYSILQQIENGSQGSVVTAFDNVNKEVVAIKIFDTSSSRGASGFSTEYIKQKILKDKAKRICAVTDSFQIPGKTGYLVMRKYEHDLFDHAFKGPVALTSKQIQKIFKRICRGVRDLHRTGVAHLDLKPENILISSDNKPYICDFGCSYYFDVDTKKGRLTKRLRKTCFDRLKGRGTKNYAAPEVFNSTFFNPFCADIYSLGILLFALYTGSFPVPKVNSKELDLTPIKQKINNRGFVLLSSMLEHHPEKRPQIESVVHHEWFVSKKLKKKTVDPATQHRN